MRIEVVQIPVTEVNVVPKGPKGDDGQSAYQAWLDAGNVGTLNDFVAFMKGFDFEDIVLNVEVLGQVVFNVFTTPSRSLLTINGVEYHNYTIITNQLHWEGGFDLEPNDSVIFRKFIK